MSPSITITTTNKEASMVYTTSYPSGSRTEWVDGVAIVPASVTGSIVIKTGKQSPGVAFGLETETFRKRTNAVEKFSLRVRSRFAAITTTSPRIAVGGTDAKLTRGRSSIHHPLGGSPYKAFANRCQQETLKTL